MIAPERLLLAASSLTDDVIAAISSPPGRGALGVVRLSGAAAPIDGLLSALLGACPPLVPRKMQLRTVFGSDGEAVDQGLVVRFPGPTSYTGEDVIELHLHGNPLLLQQALAACLDAGARAAGPGEFSRRAVLNGRLDLLEAEGVHALIQAESREAARLARRHLGGDLSRKLLAWKRRLLIAAAALEALVDFPEEISDQELAAELALIGELRGELVRLAATFAAGRRLVEGARVLLTGPVNAGKSSLFNALLGHERAIVTSSPGTTRDLISESVRWAGLALRLEDSAGLREAHDPAERAGIARSEAAACEADLLLAVRDAREVDAVAGTPAGIPVATHGDLLGDTEISVLLAAGWSVVGRGGIGLDTLRDQITAALRGGHGGDGLLLHSTRQLRAIEGAAELLTEALSLGFDEAVIAASAVRDAGRRLEELVGLWSEEAVLDELFARFCIGK